MTTSKARGIPTMFEHRRYRSRLEARWAALFSLLKWPFEYEPFDLGGWIPDFVLYGKSAEVLVEVKPYSRLEQFDVDRLEKIMLKERDGVELLLIGSSIWNLSNWDGMSLGWLGEYGMCSVTNGGDGKASLIFDETLILSSESNQQTAWDFCHSVMGYWQRMGTIPGDYGGSPPIACPESCRQLWNQAGNLVQWMARS